MGKFFSITSGIIIVLYILDYKAWMHGSVSFVIHNHSPLVLIVFFNFLGIFWVLVKAIGFIKNKKFESELVKLQISLYIFTLFLTFTLYKIKLW